MNRNLLLFKIPKNIIFVAYKDTKKRSNINELLRIIVYVNYILIQTTFNWKI